MRTIGNLFINLENKIKEIESRIGQEAKPLLVQAIKDAYEESKQPGGDTFAPLKKPTGKKPVIGLKDYYTYVATNNQVRVTATKKPYAVFHHTGTRFMPPRTPWAKGQIPKEWEERIGKPLLEKITRKLMRKDNVD